MSNSDFSDPKRLSLWIHRAALEHEGKSFTCKYNQELQMIFYRKGTFRRKISHKYDQRKSANQELKRINRLDGVSCSVTSDAIKKEFTPSGGGKGVTVTREVTISVSAPRAQAEFASAAAFINTVSSRHKNIVSHMVNDLLHKVKDPVEAIEVTRAGLNVTYYNFEYNQRKKVTFSFRNYGMTALTTLDEGVGLILVINSMVAFDPYTITVFTDQDYDDGLVKNITNNLGSVTLKTKVVTPSLNSWM